MGCVEMADDEAPGKLAPEILSLVYNQSALKQLSDNILRMALPDSDNKIADAVAQIIEKR